ncbi:ribokinase [Microbacterium sp. BWT-B31]|uniref:ribokinase n=1 Tax=Microbacterium sp. BWT-B31 TaxID=3232072 RepID=UPI003526D220
MSVVVVGSANLDHVSRVERIPAPGETVLSTSFALHPGGKGANQATAAARAGAETTFIVALGDDENGRRLAEGLRSDGVALLARVCDEATGSAMISVSGDGENAIVVNPGANATLRELDERERAAVRAADVLLVQLEVPLETVAAALREARGAGTVTVLNAAPAADLPPGLLSDVDVLVVNEHEAALMAAAAREDGGGGRAEGEVEPDAATLAARVATVLVTCGADGVLVARRGEPIVRIPAHPAVVVDTTGAGDAFCGALVAALAQAGDGWPDALESAVRFAAVAAALAVGRAGAAASIPCRDEIEAEAAGRAASTVLDSDA